MPGGWTTHLNKIPQVELDHLPPFFRWKFSKCLSLKPPPSQSSQHSMMPEILFGAFGPISLECSVTFLDLSSDEPLKLLKSTVLASPSTTIKTMKRSQGTPVAAAACWRATNKSLCSRCKWSSNALIRVAFWSLARIVWRSRATTFCWSV